MHSVSPSTGRFPSFQQSSPLAILASGIFIIDLLLPLGVAAGVLYVTVILLSLRHHHSELPLWSAIGCTILTITAFFLSPGGGELWKVAANRTLALFVIWTTTLMGRIHVQQVALNQYDLLLTSQVFQASHDHISILGRDFRYRRVNPSYEKVHGRNSQEVVGMEVSELLGEDIFENTVKPKLDRCFQGEEVHYEAWFRFADNQDHYMAVSYLPLVAVNTDIEEIVVIAKDLTDRKQIEEGLQANQEQLRTVLDAMTNFVGIGTVDGVVTDCNQAPLEMAGLTREDVLGKSFFDTYWLNYSPKVQEQVRGIVQRVGRGKIVREDYQARMGENLIVTVDACFVPVKDRNGQVQQIVHSGIDVSDRRRAEHALQISEDQFRDLYESAPLAYFSASFDGHIIRVNGRASDLLGYSQQELLGMRVLSLYASTKDGIDKAAALQKKAQDGISIQNEELEMVKKDGSILWVGLTVRLILDESGKISERRGMVQDISDRKRIESELRASEYRFRSLIETAGSIIIGLTSDGWIVEWNREAERLYGQNREQALDKNYFETFILESDRLHIVSDIKNVLTGTPLRDLENTILDSDGRKHQISWNMDRLLDEDQQPYGIICIGREITEWKAAQSQLQKWATIYQHTQWGVAVGDADSQILESVNKTYAQMHGYTIEELEGQPIMKLFAPEFRNQLPGILEVFKEKERHSFEAPRMRKDGSTFPALVTISTVKDTDGTMLYEVANVIDISTLKDAEKELKKSDERLKMALEASSSGTWDWNIQTGAVHIGGEWLASLGYQPEDLGSTVNDWKDIIHPDDLAQAKKEMSRHFAKETTVYESINRIRMKSGEWRWNYDRGRVVEWTTDGKPVRMVGTDTDITIRMETEEALKKSELRFRTYFETGLIGMGMMSLEKMWLEMNNQLCAILGYSREELQSKTWSALTYPDDRPLDETEFNKLFAGTQNSYSTSKRFFHKDGSLLYANIYVHAVRKSSGEVDYFTAMLEDITEQKLGESLLMKWAMIFQHTQWGVAVSKAESSNFDIVNEAYARMHGYAIREMDGMSVAQVFTPDFRSQLPSIIEEIHHKGFLSFEAEHLRKDGSTFPSLVTVSAIKDHNQQVLYRVANVIDISDLKETQRALFESRKIFQDLVQTIEGIVWECDFPSMQVTFVSQFAEHFLGYPLADWRKDPQFLLTIIHPDDRPRIVRECNEASWQKNNHILEYRVMHTNSSYLWIRDHVTVVVSNDEPIKLRGIMIDITERKQADEQLQESQAWISGMVNIANDAVIAINDSQQITLFNQGAEKIFGYTASEILGQSLLHLLPQRFTDQHQTHILNFSKSTDPARRMGERAEVYGRRKDGNEFPAEASISKLDSSKGTTFTVILRDISERKDAQEAMAQLAAIVETSDDAIMGKDLNGKIVSWNQGAERLFGYTAEEAIGLNKKMLLPHDRKNEVIENLRKVQKGEVIQQFETLRRHKDGTIIQVALSVSPIRDPAGALIGASTIARDITEQKFLETTIQKHNEELEIIVEERAARIQELEQRRMHVEKLAALSQIAAGVAHEINNPLASISQSLVLLKRAVPPDHPHYRYMAKTEDCIERIAIITKHLYQLYRPSSPMPTPIDIRICIQAAIEIMEERAFKHEIRIHCPSLRQPIMVQVSQGELIQVLCNLIHNAIDASAKDDTIELSLTTKPTSLTLFVADQGEGIPQEAIPHIFEPFYTTKQNNTEGGMGLGLSISHSLIESMGGALDFSTSMGHGSTFTITLPLT